MDKLPYDFISCVHPLQQNATEYLKWVFEDALEPKTYLNLLVDDSANKVSTVETMVVSNIIWCVVAATNYCTQTRSESVLYFFRQYV